MVDEELENKLKKYPIKSQEAQSKFIRAEVAKCVEGNNLIRVYMSKFL